MRISNEIMADNEYVYDPEHKKNPGGAYIKTPKGWSKSQKLNSKTEFNKMIDKIKSVKETLKTNIFPEVKDIERIKSINLKAGSNKEKVYKYVSNMAKAITDPNKAARRGVAAFRGFQQYGQYTSLNLANIFFNRAIELQSKEKQPASTVKQIPESPISDTHRNPPKFKKLRPKINASMSYLIKDNNLQADEVEELTGFKKTIMDHPMMSSEEFKKRIEKGIRLPRNQSQLKAAFVRNMDISNYGSPEEFQRAKERIQKMSINDFGKLLGAIMTEEEII